MKTIYLTDRSRIDTREECERKRLLQYDFDVEGEIIGLQRRATSLPLLNGTEIHEAHAKLLAAAAGFAGYEHYTVELIVTEMRQRYQAQVAKRGVFGADDPALLEQEQMALLEALLRSFKLTWLPMILDGYEVVTIEKPMDWEMAPGLVQKLRFDTVLRRRGDDQLVILDYKSTSMIGDVWDKKLERSTQTSLYVTAAEELFGESVEMAYLGMVKGRRRQDTAKSSPFFGQKIQDSSFLYAYALKGAAGTAWEPKYTPKKGFQKLRVYEEMPVKEWIEFLWADHRQLVKASFAFVPPFAPVKAERMKRKSLIVREELEYIAQMRGYWEMKRRADETGDEVLAHKVQEMLDYIVAPKRESSCFKYGGEAVCPMYGICWNEGGIDTVLDDGEFERREPHHSTELEEAA